MLPGVEGLLRYFLAHIFIAMAAYASNFSDTFGFLLSSSLEKSYASSWMKPAEGKLYTPKPKRANEHTLMRTCAKMEVSEPWARVPGTS